MKLSKREIVMLIFLIIIALVFVEYRFVITPGIAKYEDLVQTKSQVSAQVDAINLNIATAKMLEKRRDENMEKIKILSSPFLNGIDPDSLLAFIHELLLKHEFEISSYSPSQIVASQMSPEFVIAIDLVYDLKTLAQQYQNIGQPTPTPQPDVPGEPTEGESIEPKDTVEQFNIIITARGTYDKIYSLIADIQNMNRSIVITNLNMQLADIKVSEPAIPTDLSPTPTVTPVPGVEPIQPVSVIDFEIWLNFFGITKLEPSPDSILEWKRPAYIGSSDDPFYQPTPTPAISPTVTPAPQETQEAEP